TNGSESARQCKRERPVGTGPVVAGDAGGGQAEGITTQPGLRTRRSRQGRPGHRPNIVRGIPVHPRLIAGGAGISNGKNTPVVRNPVSQVREGKTIVVVHRGEESAVSRNPDATIGSHCT